MYKKLWLSMARNNLVDLGNTDLRSDLTISNPLDHVYPGFAAELFKDDKVPDFTSDERYHRYFDDYEPETDWVLRSVSFLAMIRKIESAGVYHRTIGHTYVIWRRSQIIATVKMTEKQSNLAILYPFREYGMSYQKTDDLALGPIGFQTIGRVNLNAFALETERVFVASFLADVLDTMANPYADVVPEYVDFTIWPQAVMLFGSVHRSLTTKVYERFSYRPKENV